MRRARRASRTASSARARRRRDLLAPCPECVHVLATHETRRLLQHVRSGLHEEHRSVGAQVITVQQVVHLGQLGGERLRLASLGRKLRGARRLGLLAVQALGAPLARIGRRDVEATTGPRITPLHAEADAAAHVHVEHFLRLSRGGRLAESQRFQRTRGFFLGVRRHLVELALLGLKIHEERVLLQRQVGGAVRTHHDLENGAGAREVAGQQFGDARERSDVEPVPVDAALDLVGQRLVAGDGHRDLQVADVVVGVGLVLILRTIAEHRDAALPFGWQPLVTHHAVQHVLGDADAFPRNVDRQA
jgi:hypothetical protein